MQKPHNSRPSQQARLDHWHRENARIDRWHRWRPVREAAIVAVFVAWMVLLFRAVM
jgi:hypothetical protein